MRSALLLAAAIAAASVGAAQAEGDGPLAAAPDRDDAFAQAVQAPAPRPAPQPTVVVRARPAVASPKAGLIVASTAPERVFDEDEEGARIDAFIDGPITPGPALEAQARPCDPTPHGEVGIGYGGGSHVQGGGGYGHGGPAGGQLPRAGGALGLGFALQRRASLACAGVGTARAWRPAAGRRCGRAPAARRRPCRRRRGSCAGPRGSARPRSRCSAPAAG